jgi:hypothetical protein
MVAALTFAMLVGFFCSGQQARASEEDEEPFLWTVPESGTLLLAPLGGWSVGNQLDGPVAGMRALFVFDYFLGGVDGQAIFVDTGAIYLFGLDLHGRYGPFYGGMGFTAHFFPGSGGSTTPSINFQIGTHFPTPFDGAFVEIAYRISIIFHTGREETYHTFLLGLLFESAT